MGFCEPSDVHLTRKDVVDVPDAPKYNPEFDSSYIIAAQPGYRILTYVYTVRARILWKLCMMASVTCTIILESASS